MVAILPIWNSLLTITIWNRGGTVTKKPRAWCTGLKLGNLMEWRRLTVLVLRCTLAIFWMRLIRKRKRMLLSTCSRYWLPAVNWLRFRNWIWVFAKKHLALALKQKKWLLSNNKKWQSSIHSLSVSILRLFLSNSNTALLSGALLIVRIKRMFGEEESL